MKEHEIRLGDCLDPLTGLASLADKSLDHVICDPPYSRDLYSRTRTNAGRRGGSKEFRAWIEMGNLAIGAVDDILDDVAAQILRVATRWIIVFSDVEIAPRWRSAFGGAYLRTGVWVKPDAMPQITGDRPGQGFEAATIAHVGSRKKWNGGGKSAVWMHGTSKGADRPDHPCPKPLSLMEELIADFTDPMDIVCDPFAGSGTTGVACKRLGRRFIGWERDATFWERAVMRLENTRRQYELLPRGPKPRQQKMVLP